LSILHPWKKLIRKKSKIPKSHSNLILWIDRKLLSATNFSLDIFLGKKIRQNLSFPKRIFKFFTIWILSLKEIFMSICLKKRCHSLRTKINPMLELHQWSHNIFLSLWSHSISLNLGSHNIFHSLVILIIINNPILIIMMVYKIRIQKLIRKLILLGYKRLTVRIKNKKLWLKNK
jgi:hypothetical protein